MRVTDLSGTTLHESLMGMQPAVRPTWIQWANNERLLVGVSLNILLYKVPVEYTYIFTQSLDEKTPRVLVDSNGKLRQFNSNVLNFLMDDPVYILMSINNLKTNAPEVRKVNVSTGKFIKVQKSDKNIQSWFADLNGDVRIGRGIKHKTRSSTNPEYEMRVKLTGKSDWLSHHEFANLDYQTPIFGFTENPNELIIGDYGDKDTLGMYIYDLNDRKISKKLFHHETYDVQGAVYSADGKSLIGARYVSHTPQVTLFDTSSPQSATQSNDVSQHYRFLDQSADGAKTLYEISGPSDSGKISIHNNITDNLTDLATQYAGLSQETLGKVFDVEYTSRDDFKIPAYITLPAGKIDLSTVKNLPFIVLPHGGPYARTSDTFDYFAQFFASRGFGVLQMNFRGSEGYGKSFEESGRTNWELMLDDIKDGTTWLFDQGLADPDKTCIAGWSFGGYAALMGAINDKDLYACTISVAGVTDLSDLVIDQKKYKYGQLWAKSGILAGFDGRKDMKNFSPTKRAKDIKIPVFLAHGTFDQRVHFDQFTRMKKALKKSKTPVVTRVYEGENHFLSQQENRQDLFKALDEFLSTYVLALE